MDNNNESIRKNQLASTIVGMIDVTAIIGFFTMHIAPILLAFLMSVGKYFLLPVNIAASVIQMVLAWRQVALERNDKGKMKTHLIVKAIVETLAGAAIITACLGAMFFSAVFGAATAMIFSITLAAKTLFHMGSAIFYTGKAAATIKNPAECQKNLNRAKDNLLHSVAGVLATTAITVVMVLGKTVMTGLGIASGVLSLISLAYKLNKLRKAKKAGYEQLASEPADESTDTPRLTSSTASLRKSLDSRNSAGSSMDAHASLSSGSGYSSASGLSFGRDAQIPRPNHNYNREDRTLAYSAP